MKILFLGAGDLQNKLIRWLEKQGEEVVAVEEKINFSQVKKISPKIIISYNYKHILAKEIIEYPKLGTINLHISYLPWNRGADPNIWSHLENTPKGVTIHCIDENIDSGDIIVQEKVEFEEDDTLRSSYLRLHETLQTLFKVNWRRIKRGKYKRVKQPSKETIHYKRDRYNFEHLIRERGWDTPLRDIKKVSKQ